MPAAEFDDELMAKSWGLFLWEQRSSDDPRKVNRKGIYFTRGITP